MYFKLPIPKIKPATAGIAYISLDQARFLETLSDGLNWLNMLGDLNINLYQNGSILEEENKNITKCANKISFETKKYLEFCKIFGLKQLIKSAIRITPNTSTLVDQILTNTNEQIIQCGLINNALSDHQMTFCSRKKKRK